MLDKSWEQSGFTGNRNECYIKGASDFQERAINQLQDWFDYEANECHLEGLKIAIEIIKQLKAE